MCSCTIVPLFAGIYKKGAGLGPALITFLFFAPTGSTSWRWSTPASSTDLAIARFLLSLTFGIGIGLIMALIFHADDVAHDLATDTPFSAQGAQMGRVPLVFLIVWIALLLAGTLKLGVLMGTHFYIDLPLGDAQAWQAVLDRLVPYDAAKGEEGVSVQGGTIVLCWSASASPRGGALKTFRTGPPRGPGRASE
ncbi:MAG: permease [Burkholderiales bacterium]